MNIRSFLIPAVIFLISFSLHLSLMSCGPVSVDCLNLAINAQATLQDHHLHYLEGSGYPLMVLLGAIFIALGKFSGITDPILSVNFMSVVFGSIAVLVFYFLTQEITDTLTAIIASFILLLNPVFLDVSTYGISHAPSLCFLLLGLLSLLRFQTTEDKSQLLISALYFGLMGSTRLPDFILTSPAIVFMFMMQVKTNPAQKNKHTLDHFFLFTVIILLIILIFHLPYYIFDHAQYAIQAQNNWQANLTNCFHGIFSKPFVKTFRHLIQTFNYISILCFCAGLFYTAALNRKLLIFTLLWWTLPLIIFTNIITIAPRYFNIFICAIIIPISIFLAVKLRDKRLLWRLVALMSFLTITIQPVLDIKETLIRRHHYALITDYYRWAGQSTPQDAVFISSDDKLFITYYAKRLTLQKPVAIAGPLSPKQLLEFKKQLDKTLNSGKPVYITNFGVVAYDPYLQFGDFMQQNYHLIQIGRMPLELWYITPFEHYVYSCALVKIEKK